jgi:hypothetical protein
MWDGWGAVWSCGDGTDGIFLGLLWPGLHNFSGCLDLWQLCISPEWKPTYGKSFSGGKTLSLCTGHVFVAQVG